MNEYPRLNMVPDLVARVEAIGVEAGLPDKPAVVYDYDQIDWTWSWLMRRPYGSEVAKVSFSISTKGTNGSLVTLVDQVYIPEIPGAECSKDLLDEVLTYDDISRVPKELGADIERLVRPKLKKSRSKLETMLARLQQDVQKEHHLTESDFEILLDSFNEPIGTKRGLVEARA